jgi:hypothetical protein
MTSSSHIFELQFADDCAAAAAGDDALERSLAHLHHAYSRVGMGVNMRKTESLSYGPHAADVPGQRPPIRMNEADVSRTSSFCYLGSILSDSCQLDEEIFTRISRASAAFGRLRRGVFLSHHLKLDVKISVYKVVVVSTLLYASETWTLYGSHVRQLEHFHAKCLQKILGLTWEDRVHHFLILRSAGVWGIEAAILLVSFGGWGT